MYVLFGSIFIICVLFFILLQCRNRKIIRRICRMDDCAKLCLLNDLLSSFGFTYSPSQDIITSTTDAWQRGFGYQALFDKTAVHFNMVFDCEPVYFDYDNKTWLIEFWKGQYGINLGGEIGVYYADTLLSPEEYPQAHFESVPDQLMLPLSIEMFHQPGHLQDACPDTPGCKTWPAFSISKKHWWLTGFRTGKYCKPEDLAMKVSLTFPNETMLDSFVCSLLRMGYERRRLCICNLTVSFTFTKPHSPIPCRLCRFSRLISCWENRFFCRLYLWITRPFTCTADRILYLYFFLPFAFRHLLLFRKNREQRTRRKHIFKCRNRQRKSRYSK